MPEIITLKGPLDLAETAYAAGVKLGAGAKDLEQERHAREAVYGYFMAHPQDLVLLVNVGFLTPEDIGLPSRVEQQGSARLAASG